MSIVPEGRRSKYSVGPTECYFPTWKVEEDHFTVKALVNAYEGLFGKAPVVDKWTFSTNGVSIMALPPVPPPRADSFLRPACRCGSARENSDPGSVLHK
ncbi:hypothetical protein NE615_27400, partial [Escherichia coli]|nr:hypothetical protein [Escherichia coli]